MRMSLDWRYETNAIESREGSAFTSNTRSFNLLVPDRRPEALVSTLTLFYYLGHIGVIARRFSTKLPGSTFQYVSRVHTNFHAQKSARRATVTTNSSPTKPLHPWCDVFDPRSPPSRVINDRLEKNNRVTGSGTRFQASLVRGNFLSLD